MAALPVSRQRGRVVVDADMSVPGRNGVWALGDCAAVPNAFDRRISPPTARFAVRRARCVAEYIARAVAAQPLRPFRYRPQGALSSIGRAKAVAEVFGVRLYGFVAWLLWRAVYLAKIPTLARNVRLFMAWNWEMLFPPDIVHLPYSRTRRSTGKSAAVTEAADIPGRGAKAANQN